MHISFICRSKQKYYSQIFIDLKIDQSANSQGTPNFRAPEISCCNDEEKINLIDPQRSNIYSAGIVLYCMMKGRLPFEEGKQEEKIWKESKNYFFKLFNIRRSSKFTNLFSKMCRQDPRERIDVNGVLDHAFLQGDTYSDEELELLLMLNQTILDQ